MSDRLDRMWGEIDKTRGEIMGRIDSLSEELGGFRHDIALGHTLTNDAERLAENVQKDVASLRQTMRPQGDLLLALQTQVAELRRKQVGL